VFREEFPMKYYIVLFLLVILVWANALNNKFVWDDRFLILENKNLDMPLSKMTDAFTKSIWTISGFTKENIYYRPMLTLLVILNYKLWGPNPVGFHVVNLLCHLMVVGVLFKVGLLLFDREKNRELIALFGASLFAVHPINNEHVGRPVTGEILFGLFVVLSIYFFLSRKKHLSLVMFFLALLSKEAAVMLPFGLLVLSMREEGIKKGAVSVMPYMALLGIYLLLRMFFMDNMFGAPFSRPFHMRIFTMIAAAFDYVRLMLIPFPLSPFYPERWYGSLDQPKVLVGFLLLFLIGLAAFRFRNDRSMLFLLFAALLMLAPVIWRVNAINVGMEYLYIAERFLYIPSMFVSLFVGAATVRLLENRRSFSLKLLVIWGVIVVIFSILAISANMVWKNEEILFESIADEHPNAVFPHMTLGGLYREQGRTADAIREWERTLELEPDIPILYSQIGNLYFSEGDYDKAASVFRRVIKRFPTQPDAYYNLSVILEKVGKKEEAAAFRKEWEVRSIARNNLRKGA